jgi:hypothetical protein
MVKFNQAFWEKNTVDIIIELAQDLTYDEIQDVVDIIDGMDTSDYTDKELDKLDLNIQKKITNKRKIKQKFKENDMNIELTIRDAKDLASAICESFYFGREDEFEILSENIPKGNNKDQVMYFYDTKLEALLSSKTFIVNDPNTAIICRDNEEYIVITSGSVDTVSDWINRN